MHKEIALTAEGLTTLEQELHHLETVRRREVGERIKEAKDFGDISENSEYDDANFRMVNDAIPRTQYTVNLSVLVI